ncbi:LysM peptidoglycan-binding domain-containing protein [Planococcus shenhongbingii]|uniref:LysM peptidoglycan-binding domain-containing protein n=1 Tax=Planococcus shenhongbingii TaxID=3058398 RepID=A0ABT8NFL8_9BACL|nr:LysM peptidoglycan-binding domain-containing protein [Planococcus sp. N017]MDN7246691.1 LysM peptidoglycan-binding domain-containing protein [Planococcus sp. N017]
MKKHIIALTAIAALSVGAAGQASAQSSYTVNSGDTLWGISQAQNVSVEQLKGWNDLSSDLIFPQQQLELGSEGKEAAVSEDRATYTVASGDTLFKVAQAHNISLEELMSWNGITGHWIYPGDKLVVKGGTPISVPKAPKEAAAPAQAAPAAAPAQAAAKAPAKAAAPAQAAASTQSGKEMTVSATAYTAFCAGCSGVTATGQDLRSNPNQKVIAVDPTVIPLGSKVWVEGYGTAIAGDTGGAIKGNKIDVFIPSQGAALDWGRKTVNIKILD